MGSACTVKSGCNLWYFRGDKTTWQSSDRAMEWQPKTPCGRNRTMQAKTPKQSCQSFDCLGYGESLEGGVKLSWVGRAVREDGEKTGRCAWRIITESTFGRVAGSKEGSNAMKIIRSLKRDLSEITEASAL
jgi:hypothetical protein